VSEDAQAQAQDGRLVVFDDVVVVFNDTPARS
jgi:hypothetical protein